MNRKVKTLLGIIVALGALGLSLYLPAVRPLKVKGISEGPSEHGRMEDTQGGTLAAPPVLAGLALNGRPMTGEEAMAQISSLHGTGIEVVDGLMAMYGAGGRRALVWISRSADEPEAGKLLAAMDARMPASKAFGNHALRSVDGRTYHFVQGQGMDNYYWQQGDLVIWLGLAQIDPAEQPEVVRATGKAFGR